LGLGAGGCSSSKQGEDSEQLESTDQEGQGEETADNSGGEQGQNAGGENFNAENGTQENAGNAEGGEQQAGGNDLQEIISDMNQTNPNAGGAQAAEAAPANAVPAQAAPVNAAPAAAAAPVAEQSTTSPGGLVGGMAGLPAGPGLPELGSKIPYVVRAGDTLGKIAAKVYGSQQRWKEIATLTGLDNPNHIYPGDVVYFQLTQEAVGFAQAYLNVTRQELTVQQGDTLATIAKRAFGSSKFWKQIWRENDHINDPDSLVVGQTVFYVTEAAMHAAVDSNENQILNPNLKNVEKDIALELLDSQMDGQDSFDQFQFETVDLGASSELITVNFGKNAKHNNVSLNS
jgi:LysM repeat protein